MWVVIAAGIALYVAATGVFGRHLIFHDVVPREPPDPAVLAGLEHRDVEFQSHDGLVLRGWIIEPAVPGRARGTVVLLHGWHRDRKRVAGHMRMLAEAGFRVFAYDQRGHGASGTGMITFGPREGRDLQCALDRLGDVLPDDGPDVRIGYGLSLGAAAILHAVDQLGASPFRCVVLEGVSATSEDAGRYMLVRKFGRTGAAAVGYGVFTVGSFIASGGRFRHSTSVDKLSSLRGTPVLYVRGEADHMVSESSAMSVIDAAPEPKEVWVNPDGGHTDNLRRNADEYRRRVLGFLHGCQGSQA